MGEVIDLRQSADPAGEVQEGAVPDDYAGPYDAAVVATDTAFPDTGAGTEVLDEDSADLGAPTLAAALEALLLLADEPMPAATLAAITRTPQLEVEATLAEMSMRYLADGRGIELRRVDTGWRYYTAEICRDLVTRYVTDGRQARLSQPALETLAIVAYRQPVTRAQVGAVRGVNSDGVLKTLAARGLIAQSGEADETAAHFVTTPFFLDRMGLGSLSELPPIAAHLPDLSSLDDLVE